jgi:cytochrome c oxidase assembly protein subunit 11
MSADLQTRTGRSRNAALALMLGGLVIGMVAIAFAAVPLYRLFCQVTGLGGTTQVSQSAPAEVGERVLKVRFNADVHRDLPWRFWPEQREVTLRVGEPGLVFYDAENLSGRAVVGTATFNVTPLKAGQYFHKVQCFCFDEQELAPGETARLGVSFFVDPAIAQDRNLEEVTTITLSYTFFRSLADPDDKPAEEAVRAHTKASAARRGPQVN